ncbi:MAG: hypothetical protein RMN25_01975 [Anaerolineae bacterium]|nr:hypothetical protein [Thermoflexales bacterium]MDW8406523.1 hypothetical protein [Anaerolineae bacterium]
MSALAAPANIDIRPFASVADHMQCDALQRRVWGDANTVSPPMSIAIQRHGGIALGAFERRSGRMIGFVLSFLAPSSLPGAARGLSQHSHMAAVAPEWQNRGVGMALKLAQRHAALAQGINLITWTYDPLEARNAMLNIHKLGAICRTYHRNYYGDMPDTLNAGLATDRFEVEWWLDAGGRSGADQAVSQAPAYTSSLLAEDKQGVPAVHHIEIDIPLDFQALKRTDLNHARAWRMRTRLQFEDAFSRGFVVVDFIRLGPRTFYVLKQQQVETHHQTTAQLESADA